MMSRHKIHPIPDTDAYLVASPSAALNGTRWRVVSEGYWRKAQMWSEHGWLPVHEEHSYEPLETLDTALRMLFWRPANPVP